MFTQKPIICTIVNYFKIVMLLILVLKDKQLKVIEHQYC